MNAAPKDARSAAERARDTAGIVGSLRHEGYVPTAAAEAIHAQVAAGQITTEQAIELFRERAVKLDAGLLGAGRSEQ
jgi:Antitoxin VbhA